MSQENKICPTCKGEKKMPIVAKMITSEGIKEAEPVMMDCSYCQGEGVVTPERQRQIDYENSLWCKCNEDHGAYRVGDGENEECSKHHYRCYECNKIVQIG